MAQSPDYILSSEYSSKSRSLDGSSSSSSGRTALAERIVATDSDGVQIEYSIPADPDDIRGNAMWMYPALVRVASDGSKTLENPKEMEARVDKWLSDAGWTRELCSARFFTWTAQQIVCEPEAIIDEVEAYGMRPGPIEAGTIIKLPHHGVSVTLEEVEANGDYKRFRGTADVNSAFVREASIKTDLAVAEMRGRTLTKEQAAEQNSDVDASGTITFEITVDEDGLVWERSETVDAFVTGDRYGDKRRQAEAIVTRVRYADWKVEQQEP